MSAPSGDRLPLSRARIVDAALTVVDREGLEALTMRRVATELGVGTMSLYNHVADKDELLESLADRVLPTVDLSSSATWSEAARKWAVDVRTTLQSKKPVSALILSGRHPRPFLRTLLEAGAVLRERGLAEADAQLVMRSVARFLAGSILLDAAGARRSRGRGQAPADELFEVGLDSLLEGLRSRVSAAR